MLIPLLRFDFLLLIQLNIAVFVGPIICFPKPMHHLFKSIMDDVFAMWSVVKGSIAALQYFGGVWSMVSLRPQPLLFLFCL